MPESPTKVLDKYTEAFRDLVNEKNLSSPKTIKDLLRLNKDEDWGFICAAMDVVEDASSAIRNFLRFGLDGPTKYEEVGERYLRLYGVLSATYIQQGAIHKLYKLMNVHNPKSVKEKFESLKIRDIRHKLGSHSTEFLNKDTGNLESFAPVRISLSQFTCEYINTENHAMERIDLEMALGDHLGLIVEVLDQIYEKAVKTLFRSDEKRIAEFHAKLDELRVIRDGGSVIDVPGGPKIIIHTIGRGEE